MNGTRAQFARHLGVNRSAVTRAIQSGRITPEADGTLDFAKAAAQWHANAGGRADVAARHAKKRGAAIPTAGQAEKNAPRAQETATPAAIDSGMEPEEGRARAKALLMHYENQQLKIEMAMRRGLRFERAAVKREAFEIGAMLRAGLERVIDHTAPRIAAAASRDERLRVLQGEVAHLRGMLKREVPRAARRLRDSGNGKGGEA